MVSLPPSSKLGGRSGLEKWIVPLMTRHFGSSSRRKTFLRSRIILRQRHPQGFDLMKNDNATNCLTPPQLAKRWGISPEKVLSMIRGGTLRYFNVANPGSRRPRYRILMDAVIEFENRSVASVASVRRKRRKQTSDFVKYF
jgi:hypothetical protein